MSEVTYWIYAGNQPVTNATDVVLTDVDEAKRLAKEISEGQPEATIKVVSRSVEPQGEWTREVASFHNGKERWRVDFYGYLMDVDHVRLSKAGVVYTDGHTEIGPNGQLRPGHARNHVSVEADSADAAIEAVKAALGPQASECSEWHAHPEQT
jgi:hypothetical protein